MLTWPRLLLSLHLLGLQSTPGWGWASRARPTHDDSRSGREPSPPGSLFTSASHGPTLKRFPPAAREARPAHTRFQAVKTPLRPEELAARPGLLTAPARPPTSLFSCAVLITHILKSLACAAESPRCSSQHPNDVCNCNTSRLGPIFSNSLV